MEKNLNRILSDQKSKTKLSLLICVSLAVASAFLLPSGQAIGWAFLVMAVITGAALAIRIRRSRTELAKLGSTEEAEKKFSAPDTVHYEPFGLTVGRDFAVTEQPALRVYLLGEMEKFEVGLAGDVRKVLFLTDRNGERYPIAETRKDRDYQKEFDKAYNQVKEIFSKRNAEN